MRCSAAALGYAPSKILEAQDRGVRHIEQICWSPSLLSESVEGCLLLCANDPESLGCVVHSCVAALGSSLLH